MVAFFHQSPHAVDELLQFVFLFGREIDQAFLGFNRRLTLREIELILLDQPLPGLQFQLLRPHPAEQLGAGFGNDVGRILDRPQGELEGFQGFIGRGLGQVVCFFDRPVDFQGQPFGLNALLLLHRGNQPALARRRQGLIDRRRLSEVLDVWVVQQTRLALLEGHGPRAGFRFADRA